MRTATASPEADRASPWQLAHALEAALFLGGDPITPERFRSAFPECSLGELHRLANRLQATYRQQRRPYAIRWTGEGYRLELEAQFREELASRLRGEKGVKLARPVLEVLSVIAYRQPISRPAVEDLLGNEAGGPIRQLLRRQLIAPGAKDEHGVDQYVTTARFLDLFQLESLADLPATEDTQKL